MSVPRVLIVAGSDSGGGAGIQADLKTVSALGAFGMTAITALTAQNTTGVYGVVEMTPEFVALQMEVCVTDIGCDAVKTGMLANAAIIRAVAEQIRKFGLRPLVVDPVMVAKSGAPLLKPDAVDALVSELFPLATVITPNIHEAKALTGKEAKSLDEMRDIAAQLKMLGPQWVIVKGGHLEGSAEAVDILYDGTTFTEFRAPRFETHHTHGTG
ncbi:Hydroxymethylpyrimidine/phosphomethylpyrimidine kinase [bacterium HR17]|jgi:hydroxymethylpyrimidine/phosphomethylpyrimidine kinase|uniref:hydroxymethylpyrimidine kinase n=1 Tax=Candidatus Fervidibacter japonicus TaxID=2035412 RepID=A0A2H5XB49_9BACT|nr:Hydroxymethylpyrimidine/phosphomethylpyrimidine kinase [bacterium HR17]